MEIGGECIKTVYISKGVIKGILKKRFDLKKLIAFFYLQLAITNTEIICLCMFHIQNKK